MYRLHFCKLLKSVIRWSFVECPDFQRILIMTAVCRNIHSNFQGVIVTPLVELTPYSGVIFWGVILTPKRSLKNSFSGVKVTPDIEELK